VMALGLLVMAVFTPVFSSWVLESALGPVDRVLGFVFGVARGALLVVVAYMLYGALIGDPQTVPQIADARVHDITVDLATRLEAALPDQLPPWLSDRIDALMAPCAGEGLAEPEGFPDTPDTGTAN